MQRTQIYLETTQRRVLKELARERGATLSELIREAIWNLVSSYRRPRGTPLEKIVALYGDAADREGSLRHDDLYE